MNASNHKARILVALCTLTLLPDGLSSPGGPITPTGPPGVIYKTLDEVEPRTPISALPYSITQPGAYYLTKNLTGASGQNGITVTASDVTLDLRGFALIGVAGSLDGVNVSANVTNVMILNGTATRWGGMGVDADTAYNSQLLELRVSRNTSRGLSLGQGGIIRNCTARTNGADGINASAVCTVINCISVANGDDGIEVGTGSSVSGCSVSGNADDGILAGDGSIITGNAASGNTGDGIQVGNDSQIANNNTDGNGAGAGNGAGVHATGTDNDIMANNVTDNDLGLDIDSGGNVVADNTVRRNTSNYEFAQGNQLNLLLAQIPQTIIWPCKVVLAGALTGTSGNHGITIATNDVTLDLGGHALIGVAGSLNGVSVSGSPTNITVRNGAIRNWGSNGVQAVTAYNSQFADLKVASCAANGIQAGLAATVKSCSARANGADGISTSAGCNISDCAAAQNKSDGIVASTASTISGCNAFDNGSSGIIVSSGSLVVNCSAYSNTNGIYAFNGSTVRSCTAYANATNGIVVATGSSVTHCTAYNNRVGINVASGCRVLDNTTDTSVVAGILVNGSDNRIEGNSCTFSNAGRGIDCNPATGNLIIRNSASGNSVNYDIAAANTVGPILSAANPIASTNPWANFSF